MYVFLYVNREMPIRTVLWPKQGERYSIMYIALSWLNFSSLGVIYNLFLGIIDGKFTKAFDRHHLEGVAILKKAAVAVESNTYKFSAFISPRNR